MNNKKHRDLQLSNEAFSIMNTHYHLKWMKLEKLYKSKHDKKFIDLAKKQERSHLFIPLAKSTMDILDAIFAEAFFGAGNPVEIVKNETDESEIAACLNVLTDYYYKKSKPYVALNMAFSSAGRFGVGAVLPFWDKNRKMPVTRFIPPTKIAFDNEAVTRDEIQYTSYKFKQTKQDVAQKVKSKFYDKILKKDLSRVIGSKFDRDGEKYKRVDVTEVYSKNADATFTCRTFINNYMMREKKFKTNPIKFGYLTALLPTIYEEMQQFQSAGIGESVLETIEDLIREANQKRNQIVDINEQIIDPYTMVGDEADIEAEDAGRIKGVVNVGNPDKVKRFPPTSSFPIEKELSLVEKDIDDLTAINGMQRGETSSSDRRAASAMAMINANSSSRLSKMATTINDTLFNDWAEAFAHDIYVNAPDDVIENLYGSNPLGKLGTRQEMDYVVNVNFGQSINRDAKISELTMLLQMLNGRDDADVMPILEEVLKLILGDAFDAKSIFRGVLGTKGDTPTNGGVQGEASGVAGDSEQNVTGEAQRGSVTDGTSTGNFDATQQDGATQNKI